MPRASLRSVLLICAFNAECLLWVCAVKRRRFPVGASPTRQPLQPEAIGAVMEVTKWLKPSISVSRIGDSASVQLSLIHISEPTRLGMISYAVFCLKKKTKNEH